ncbi:MAG: dynamin family protein [Pseudomonadota bacterium]
MSLAELAPTDMRAVSPTAHARLTARANRVPRMAIMGEFSSGKSTLMNFLLDQEVLPTQVTATHLPAIWLDHGPSDRAEAVHHDGRRTSLRRADLLSCDPDETAFVRGQSEAAFLSEVSLLDTPGLSDPLLARYALERISGYADFVLWCTHATQAWRQSERAAWEVLPERLHSASLLAVTRADMLSDTDRERVRKRLVRETGGQFGEIIFLATPDADRARRTGDADLFDRSGGAPLLAAIARSAASARAALRAPLDRYAVVEETVENIPPKEAKSSPAKPKEIDANFLAIWDESLARARREGSNNLVSATIDHFVNIYNGIHGSSDLAVSARDMSLNP